MDVTGLRIPARAVRLLLVAVLAAQYAACSVQQVSGKAAESRSKRVLQQAETKAAANQSAFEAMTPAERQAFCDSRYPELYANLGHELRWWNSTGITLELMEATIAQHTTRSWQSTKRGFVAGFRQGRAIQPDKPSLRNMKALVDLEDLFGPLIPDCDFVISTSDIPLHLAPGEGSQPPQPVMRFCRTDSHSDILIPVFHFYMTTHSRDPAATVEASNRNYPWGKRKEKAFGRFTLYDRFVHINDTHAQRQGVNGTQLCQMFDDTFGILTCPIRDHLIQYAHQVTSHRGLDIATRPRVPMSDHAQYKYLVHVDGQGLSSRLDQLLPLGSLVVKEESGYYGYYHHLMKPYTHYVPFWKKGPEDILAVLDWARTHDPEAQTMGQAAQLLAATYLTREARACYWLRLLQSYARLMRYKPGAETGSEFMQYNKPIREYLATEAEAYEGGAHMRRWTFAP